MGLFHEVLVCIRGVLPRQPFPSYKWLGLHCLGLGVDSLGVDRLGVERMLALGVCGGPGFSLLGVSSAWGIP